MSPAAGDGACAESEASLNQAWVYWFWLNGNVTPTGITHDLEAMASIGISGAIILSSHVGDEGKYQYATAQWYEIVQHTIREAARLGMRLDFNNGDGWADASGPWIPIEESMQKLVWTESYIRGMEESPIELLKPEDFENSYKEFAVLAFRTPAGAGTVSEPVNTLWQDGTPSFVLHDYGQPVTARSAQVRLWAGKDVPILTPVLWSLEASIDGIFYKEIYRFDNHWRYCDQKVHRVLHLSCRFKAQTARYFRLRIPYQDKLAGEIPAGNESNPQVTNHFALSGEDLISQWEMKGGHFDNSGGALEQPSRYPNGFRNLFYEFGTSSPVPEQQSVISQQDMLDISTHLRNGILRWTPPSPGWTILRIGYTAIGKKNNIATATGRGYYVDRFNAEAMDDHFSHLAGRVTDRNRSYAGKSLAGFHMDSSECGPQNWGSNLPIEFQKRRGYSIIPWLPVLAGGRIVGSLEQSERFLWDFRRTIADLFADCWWGRLATLCHRNGLLLTGEGAGRMAFMLDPLLYLSKADFPMGEFWIGEMDVRPDCALARSAANCYGKKAVFGESFTSATWIDSPYAGAWQDHPYSLKKLGDRAFASGINHFVFHRSISQPDDSRPGVALPQIGINMERSNTWWGSGGKAWLRYLERCQTLLRSGREIVDICVLMDEDVPNYLLPPDDLPVGYRLDGLHHELLKHATVEEGQLVLASGMRYRMLVMPDSGLLRPQTVSEVARLIDTGLVVAGKCPQRSPSLEDYPRCDVDVKELIGKCWGGKNVFSSVRMALDTLGLQPDFAHSTDPVIEFIHRQNERGDFYFLANQSDQPQSFKATFRVGNAQPFLIDPDTGNERRLGLFHTGSRDTSIDLHLAARESTFVFLPAGPETEVVSSVEADNGFNPETSVHQDGSLNVFALTSGSARLTSTRGRHAQCSISTKKPIRLEGRWTVSFPDRSGAPPSIELSKIIALNRSTEDGVRHFSGTATYRTQFEISDGLPGEGELAFLDLSNVGVIAEATLNGVALGTKWKPPFRYDISETLRNGQNDLVLKVTNLWANRLIGDSALASEKRVARTNYNPYSPESPLPLSGIEGPVSILFSRWEKIIWS
jgi:hypothetical protein